MFALFDFFVDEYWMDMNEVLLFSDRLRIKECDNWCCKMMELDKESLKS